MLKKIFAKLESMATSIDDMPSKTEHALSEIESLLSKAVEQKPVKIEIASTNNIDDTMPGKIEQVLAEIRNLSSKVDAMSAKIEKMETAAKKSPGVEHSYRPTPEMKQVAAPPISLAQYAQRLRLAALDAKKPVSRLKKTEHDISSPFTKLDISTSGSSDTESESESDGEFSPSTNRKNFNREALCSISGASPSRKLVADKTKWERSSPHIESGVSAIENPSMNKTGAMKGHSKPLEFIPFHKVVIDEAKFEKSSSNIKASASATEHQNTKKEGEMKAKGKGKNKQVSFIGDTTATSSADSLPRLKLVNMPFSALIPPPSPSREQA
ncbi:hypothetical protein B0T22DRAFT_182756 [Podospora appendiculata]|uniref:Uncharacterized protein n=1 Tax=Podospora appendiculata TaxID=314037 RepID=A0AAE1CDX1_9PEZI|nr:hypothetical protein B0T22DRAFT_182756 [Podospora appendiculata]